jgi:type VI secretion system protein ImpA
MAECTQCVEAIAGLERVLDRRLGVDGPSFTAAKSAVDSVMHFLMPMMGEGGSQQGAPSSAVSGTVSGGVHGVHGVAAALPMVVTGPVQSRAQALAQLRAVVKDDALFAHIEQLLGIENPGS